MNGIELRGYAPMGTGQQRRGRPCRLEKSRKGTHFGDRDKLFIKRRDIYTMPLKCAMVKRSSNKPTQV